MWIMDLQKALENFPVKYRNRFVVSKIIPGDGCIVFRGTNFTDIVYFKLLFYKFLARKPLPVGGG